MRKNDSIDLNELLSDEVQETSPRKKFGIRAFSPFEKLVIFTLLVIALVTGLVLANRATNSFIEEIPASGGIFTEGIIGSPRFINPLLAASNNADRDLIALTYAGLMKPTPMGLRPELAERFSISEDGLTYRFTLKDNIIFHDGVPVTADDVVFTIEAIQNPAIKSPRAASWEGVTVEKASDREIVFTLEQPYAPFLENTTIGILPKHIWEFATVEEFPFSEFNISPIGAGPYKVKKIRRNDSGIPEEYIVERFEDYTLGRPHIEEISFHFYRNEADALIGYTGGEVDSLNGISPAALATLDDREEFTIMHSPLPRIFGVFFNKNRAEVFTRKEVRQALDLVVNKQALVDFVLEGYGSPIDSPIPLEVFPDSFRERTLSTSTPEQRTEEAKKLLLSQGWERSTSTGIWERESNEGTLILAFTLATANTPELRDSSEFMADQWREFGADVEVQVFEPSDLTQNVIRPRRYDALFFGEIVGRELDLFAFWHSSQRNDPGLNIALYTSISADALLETARTSSEPSDRLEAYAEFENEIKNDAAAVFVYSPDFIYLAPNNVRNVSIDAAASPHERFLNIHEWYIETSRVWNLFE